MLPLSQIDDVFASRDSICVGDTLHLSTNTTGGNWSSSDPTIATVDNNGVMTGIAYGDVKIRYVLVAVNGCVDSASKNITVRTKPDIATPATPPAICEGSRLEILVPEITTYGVEADDLDQGWLLNGQPFSINTTL